MYAAITGDIIGSARLDKNNRDQIFEYLFKEFKLLNSGPHVTFPLEFVRGDSFQGVINDISKSLNTGLMIKAIFKKTAKDIDNSHKGGSRQNWRLYNNLDIRLSVGIGQIEYLKNTLALSDGTALQLSGRNLEAMKSTNKKTLITSTKEHLNKELEVELKLLDAIMDRWTPMSAETVYYLLQGYKETEIAKALSVSQSAINQRKKTANWDAITLFSSHFEFILAKNF